MRRYLQSSAELQQFLCSFHLVREQTSALLVDGFDRFFPDERCGRLLCEA
jgi:hypothetical protein